MEKESKNNIYQKLLVNIDEFLKKYSFLNETYDFFNSIIILVMKQNKNQEYDFLVNQAIKMINKIIKDKLNNYTSGLVVINNYINNNFEKLNNYNQSIVNLNRLSNFFTNYEFIPSLDLLIELIKKNKLLRISLKYIVDKNISLIENLELEKYFKDNNIVLLIEAYCIIYEIYTSDSLSQLDEKNLNLLTYKLKDADNLDSIKLYLNEISRKPLLTKEEEQQLFYEYLNGNLDSKNELIERNLKLVVSIAKKYLNRGLDFMDLIGAGNEGLVQAVSKYDINFGTRFSTYATYWIKNKICRAIYDYGKPIRIPINIQEKINKYKKVKEALENELKREVKIEEIANRMGLSIEETKKVNDVQFSFVSLNSKANDEDSELGDFIENEDNTEVLALKNINKIEIFELLKISKITERERNILKLRFGFINNRIYSLEEIGKEYGLTRERVRQIEAKALKKIKNYIKYNSEPNFRKKSKTVNKKEIGERKDKNMKRLQTIYEFFNEYKKEDIDYVLKKLDETEKNLIKLRYGEDLNHPKTSQVWDKNYNNKFYGFLIPKLRRKLALLKYETNVDNDLDKIEDNSLNLNNQEENINTSDQVIVTNQDMQVEQVKKIDNQEEKKENRESLTKNILLSNISIQSENFEKETDLKMLELLRNPIFIKMLKDFSLKELIVIYLKLGFLDGKCFTTDAISNFLGIESKEVIEITKRALYQYRENINIFIDHLVDLLTDSKSI